MFDFSQPQLLFSKQSKTCKEESTLRADRTKLLLRPRHHTVRPIFHLHLPFFEACLNSFIVALGLTSPNILCNDAMPLVENVDDLSDSVSSARPTKRRRKSDPAPENSAKQNLESEVHLRFLVASSACCKRKCLNSFQAPSKFQSLHQYRVTWAKTHKLDQDVIATHQWFRYRFRYGLKRFEVEQVLNF